MSDIKSIEWVNGRLRLLDQTRLPGEEVYLEVSDYRELVKAIKEMRLRGAPLLGVAGAYGLALGAQAIQARSREEFLDRLGQVLKAIAATRPTARNLFWALERMDRVARSLQDMGEIKAALLAEAQAIQEEDVAVNRRLGAYGEALIPDGATVLTHCNAGALATAGYGTALGVIRAAVERGKRLHVYVDETRPLLQGARLTAWELKREAIPATIIADAAAGSLLSRGVITCCLTGADRIAANGDAANKIGTYSLAVLAMENGVPFYLAAPTSTIDLSLASGEAIPIEERSQDEVTHFQGLRVAPEGVPAANPAFDITPHHYISAIISERGIIRPPYGERLKKLLEVEVGSHG